MTVKELIDKLQQFNGDRVVLVEDAEYGEFQAIDVKLEDPTGDTLKENDIKRFISNIENVKVGTKTTNTTLTCLTGFEVHGQAACVKPENFDLNVGSNYARIKAEDKIWEGLGFVLQWAKYGLKK
ncbi:MAG: hypothetical protein [Bacteriophage sp.]|nr:MAG: hypothetical protein [Bacteriophage sp.]